LHLIVDHDAAFHLSFFMSVSAVCIIR
jgi:hypothetical protein